MKHLFSFPDEAQSSAIEAVMLATKRAVPIPSKHRRDLPFAIKDLSRLLTEERGGITRSYWASPRFFSAYAYYFLPWNLYRLAFVLPSLDLRLKPGSRILDLGSGPLTLPLALWCARPDLRQIPLHFACADVAQRPLDGGRAIFQELAPESLWTIDLVRAPLDQAIGSSAAGFDCIMAGNVLNELVAAKGKPLEERIDKLVRAATVKLSAKGSLFFIEPGTRLGGKMVSYARKGALGAGLSVQAPCTHQNPCPMEAQQAYFSSAPPPSGWCHFTCPAHGAPAGLSRLGEEAGFQRYSLALSFVLMHMTEASKASVFSSAQAATPDPDFDLDALEALYELSMEDDEGQEGDSSNTAWGSEEKSTDSSLSDMVQEKVRRLVPPLAARIISGDIRLPGQREAARYACTEAGLALVLAAGRLPSGGDAEVSWSRPEERDAKTGALVVWRAGRRENSRYGDDTLPVRQRKDDRDRQDEGSGSRATRHPDSERGRDRQGNDRDRQDEGSGFRDTRHPNSERGRDRQGNDRDRQDERSGSRATRHPDSERGRDRQGNDRDGQDERSGFRDTRHPDSERGRDRQGNDRDGQDERSGFRATRHPDSERGRDRQGNDRDRQDERSGSRAGLDSSRPPNRSRTDARDGGHAGPKERSRSGEKDRQGTAGQNKKTPKKSGASKGKPARNTSRTKKHKK